MILSSFWGQCQMAGGETEAGFLLTFPHSVGLALQGRGPLFQIANTPYQLFFYTTLDKVILPSMRLRHCAICLAQITSSSSRAGEVRVGSLNQE